MTDDTKPAEPSARERADAAFELLPPPMQDLASEQWFPYFVSKALRYLEVGAEAYRAADFFHQPRPAGPAALKQLARGCQQLAEWRGLTAEVPLTGLGIEGMYALAAMLHLTMVEQHADFRPDGSALDRMEFAHRMTGARTVIWNLVEPRPSRKRKRA
jgi:hypothetical protein